MIPEPAANHDVMTDEELLDEIKTRVSRGTTIPPELVASLLAMMQQRVETAAARESAFVDEIQRLNGLIRELFEYVDTIAETIEDSFGSNEVASQVKQRAVKMIIESVQRLRDEHPTLS
jgi:hypothetical protein